MWSFRIVSLIYYYAKILCVFPFTKIPDKNEFRLSRINYYFSVVFVTFIFISYPILVCDLIIDGALAEQSLLVFFLSILEFGIIQFSSFFGLLLFVRVNHILPILNELLRIDSKISRIIIHDKRDQGLLFKLKSLCLFKIIKTPFLLIIYCVTNLKNLAFLTSLKNIIICCHFIILFLIAFMIGNFFFCGQTVIYYFLRRLHKQIGRLINDLNSRSQGYCEIAKQLDELSLIYSKIFTISCNLNDIFNIQILVHFFTIFVDTVIQLFYIFNIIIENLTNKNPQMIVFGWVITIILYVIILLSEFLYFSNISEKTKLESKKIELTLHQVEQICVDHRVRCSV